MNTHDLLSNPVGFKTLSERDTKSYLQRVVDLYKKRLEPVLIKTEPTKKLFFVGDLHGDFDVMGSVVERFLEEDDSSIVFLGDIVDRTPRDCQFGSVHSILLALLLKLHFPDRVLILRGNHEGNHAIPCFPGELRSETRARFGSAKVHRYLERIFERLPLMATSQNGILCTHAGIPLMDDWRKRDSDDPDLSGYVTWGDPLGFGIDRGFGERFNFNRQQLSHFLKSLNANVLVRGHDYTTLGTSIFDDRCLTIFTNRRFAHCGNGGVLMASTHPDEHVRSTKDLVVERLNGNRWTNYKMKVLD